MREQGKNSVQMGKTHLLHWSDLARRAAPRRAASHRTLLAKLIFSSNSQGFPLEKNPVDRAIGHNHRAIVHNHRHSCILVLICTSRQSTASEQEIARFFYETKFKILLAKFVGLEIDGYSNGGHFWCDVAYLGRCERHWEPAAQLVFFKCFWAFFFFSLRDVSLCMVLRNTQHLEDPTCQIWLTKWQ